MERPFKIDSEFSALIPTASADETSRLTASVQKHGILHPLIIWKEEKILLDGHTRLKLAEKFGIPHPVKHLSFDSRNDARNWLINHQLGRRNLDDKSRAYLLGKIYNEQKGDHGGDHRSKGHNVPLKNTAENVAKQHDVNPKTVKRAGEFAAAVDTLSKDEPDVKAAVLSGDAKASMGDITAAAELPVGKRKKVAKQIAAGKKPKIKAHPKRPELAELKKMDAMLGKLIRMATDVNRDLCPSQYYKDFERGLNIACTALMNWRSHAK